MEMVLKLVVLGIFAFFAVEGSPTNNDEELGNSKAAGQFSFPCMDRDRQCQNWVNLGYCTNDKMKAHMAVYCKKACNLCRACVDDYLTCADMAKRPGFCAKRGQLCRVSCGLCKGPTTARPDVPVKTFTPVPPVPTTASPGGTVKSFTPVTRAVPTTASPDGPVKTLAPTTGSCGKPDIKQGRVIAGVDAKRGAWPWQILILYKGKPMCGGGSLIAPQWVVTAAHCVSGDPRFFAVRVGEHNTSMTIEGKHQDVAIEKIISHPGFSYVFMDNDIALIKLATPVKFDKYVKPVCLPNQGENVPVGTECYITGWGKTKYSGSMHHTLQQGKMRVVSRGSCAYMNTRNMGITITDTMLCAGHGGKTRVSWCYGDNGGPFVCQTGADGRWILQGTSSWGSPRCDATKAYSVFARVSQFRSWIDQQMATN